MSVETGGNADMGVDDQGKEIINKNTIKIKFTGKGCKHAHWVQYISRSVTWDGRVFKGTFNGPTIDVNGTDTKLKWKYGAFYVDVLTTISPYVDLSATGTNNDGESSDFDQPRTNMPWDKITVPVSEVWTVHDYLVADDGTVLYELDWTLTYDNDHHDGAYGSITGKTTNQFNEGDGANPASFYAGDNETGGKIMVPNPNQKK